ncbi:MAG: hypothetical protein ACLGH8_18430 [Bacteroidia bacterium]
MKHFIQFLQPDFGTVEIYQPHGFNAFDLENARTTYLEVREGEAFGKLVAALSRNGSGAVANYIYKQIGQQAVSVSICFSRAHTDGATYFGMYVNDYSPAVFMKLG